MSITYGLGYKPRTVRNDVVAAARPRAIHLIKRWFSTSTALATAHSLQANFGSIFNQGMSGSCTGASTCKAARLTLAGWNKMPVVDFSPRIPYGTARQIERAAILDPGQVDLPPLTDSGCEPDDLITAVETSGMVALNPVMTPDGRYYDIWTADDLASAESDQAPNVNDEVSLDDDEAGQMNVLLGAHPVEFSSESDLANQVAALNIAGVGQTMAWFVDSENVMGWNPNNGPISKIDLRDPQGGGHQTCITYFRGLGGKLVIGFGNSWGGWGIAGFGEIYLDALMPALNEIVAYDVNIAPRAS